MKINLRNHAQYECKIRFIYINDNELYMGELKNNERSGYGIFYCDEYVYKGGWKNNAEDGFGICYYSDGSRYEGDWCNSQRHGYGIFYKDDEIIYIKANGKMIIQMVMEMKMMRMK